MSWVFLPVSMKENRYLRAKVLFFCEIRAFFNNFLLNIQ